MKKLNSLLNSWFKPIEIPWFKEYETSSFDPSQKEEVASTWNLSDEILRWSLDPKDDWQLADALRGTQIFGSTGSGKTSGSGRKIALSFLKKGFGGLVLCVKEEEARLWESLCEASHRSKDLIRVQMDASFCYNFLAEEAKSQPSSMVLNLSELFSEILSLVNRTTQNSQRDPFWMDMTRRMINYALILQLEIENTVTIEGLNHIIQGAVSQAKWIFQTKSSVSSLSDFKFSSASHHYFMKLREKAIQTKGDDLSIRQALDFFEGEFTELAEKTRSIIVVTFTSMADVLMRAPLNRLLCGGTTCTPNEAFDGKIFVIDVPIHLYHQVGLVINLVWKTAFRRACQRRVHPNRPVFLWCDESQYLVDELDVKFQTTARSTRCCTVFLTQNIQNYYAQMGSKESVKSLLGSLHHKIFHQNGEDETNQFAEESIGKLWTEVKGSSENQRFSFLSPLYHRSISKSFQWEADVPKRIFTNLKSGGGFHQFEVEGILHSPGKKFSNGKPWIQFSIDQKKEG